MALALPSRELQKGKDIYITAEKRRQLNNIILKPL